MFEGNPFVNGLAGEAAFPVILQSGNIGLVTLVGAAAQQQHLLQQTAGALMRTGYVVVGPLGLFVTGDKSGRLQAVQLPRGVALFHIENPLNLTAAQILCFPKKRKNPQPIPIGQCF